MPEHIKDKPVIPVVAACIKNAGGAYLIAQRLKNDAHAGMWEFPGGTVESGEAPPAALRRELKEELGLTIRVGDAEHVFEDEDAQRKIRLTVYSCVVAGGVPQARECQRWRYCLPARFSGIYWAPVDEKIARSILARDRVEGVIDAIRDRYDRDTRQRHPSVTKIAQARASTPFEVLASCLISLRTKDEVTLAASERLFALARTPAAVAGLSVSAIEQSIFPAGFYRKKARLLREVSTVLLQRYAGVVPRSLEDLLSLHGVGRKTAQLVRSLAFGQDAICVDTHVHRISNRIGLVATDDVFATERSLQEVIPMRHWRRLNTLMVYWGRTVCVPVSPRCSGCSVRAYCLQKKVLKSR